MCQGSEYSRILKIELLWLWVNLHMVGFWIFQDSKYACVLNMPLLHRVLNMLNYAWICLNNSLNNCLNDSFIVVCTASNERISILWKVLCSYSSFFINLFFKFQFQCKHTIFDHVKLKSSQTIWTLNDTQSKLNNKNYNISS